VYLEGRNTLDDDETAQSHVFHGPSHGTDVLRKLGPYQNNRNGIEVHLPFHIRYYTPKANLDTPFVLSYPPTRKVRVSQPWMNAERVPFEALKERSGVCFGGFRLLKHVEP